MSEWIQKLKEEKTRQEEESEREAIESSKIYGIASFMVKDLISTLKVITDELNKVFHNGAKVYEVTDNMGYFNRFEEDFVVMTQAFPAAYLFIKLDAHRRVLKRKLQTIDKPEARRTEKDLPELQVSIDATGNPIYLENERVLSMDDIARVLVEPVYRAHTKS